MALVTQQIHSGLLAEARYGTAPYPARHFCVIAETSEWFESQIGAGLGPENANNLSVTIQVEKIDVGGGLGDEELNAVLYQSEDLHTWSFKKALSFAITGAGNYEEDMSYQGTTEKYFKIQFSLDDNAHETSTQLPYPNYKIEFHGTCWVTLAHMNT